MKTNNVQLLNIKNFIPYTPDVAVHKKRERDPKKMRHHVVSHFT